MRIFLAVFLLVSFFGFTQKHKTFTGRLVYSIQICDTSLQTLIPIKYMVIHTNDTLLRIDNESDQFGVQTIIKHLNLNKSYLLIQTPNKNYAIQTDHSTEKTDSFPFVYKKKLGKKEICGLKVKKLKVSHKAFPEDFEFLYIKQYSNKYINALPNFPGLLVQYYIPTIDGIYEYKLVGIEEMEPEKDIFGIPSDFKKVTFDEFLDEIMKAKEEDLKKEHE